MYFGQIIPNGTVHKLSLDGEGNHIINDKASWVFGIYASMTSPNKGIQMIVVVV